MIPKKRLRVVIPMLHYYADHPSGSDRLAYDQAIYLAEHGHEVWVIAQDLSESHPEYSFQDNLHVLRYPPPKLGKLHPRRRWAHYQITKALLRRYVGNQVDIVHGHSLLNYEGALAIYADIARTCYSVHSPVRLEMLANSRGSSLMKRVQFVIAAKIGHYIEHRCLNISDKITAFSNYTISLIQKLHGDDVLRKMQVIPGWVDLDRFQIISDQQATKSQLGWPLDHPVFFTLRRLVPRMGLDRLLLALKKVKSAGFEFNLIVGGSGPLYSTLILLAQKLNLEGNVHFVGFVPEAKLPLLYASADAFVLPTTELECFGLTALEALACGRPVLATPVGAIPEVLGTFEPRWLAQDESIDSIGLLLIDFLRGNLPIHEPNALRQKVAEKYSKNIVLEQLTRATIGDLVK